MKLISILGCVLVQIFALTSNAYAWQSPEARFWGWVSKHEQSLRSEYPKGDATWQELGVRLRSYQSEFELVALRPKEWPNSNYILFKASCGESRDSALALKKLMDAKPESKTIIVESFDVVNSRMGVRYRMTDQNGIDVVQVDLSQIYFSLKKSGKYIDVKLFYGNYEPKKKRTYEEMVDRFVLKNAIGEYFSKVYVLNLTSAALPVHADNTQLHNISELQKSFMDLLQ